MAITFGANFFANCVKGGQRGAWMPFGKAHVLIYYILPLPSVHPCFLHPAPRAAAWNISLRLIYQEMENFSLVWNMDASWFNW